MVDRRKSNFHWLTHDCPCRHWAMWTSETMASSLLTLQVSTAAGMSTSMLGNVVISCLFGTMSLRPCTFFRFHSTCWSHALPLHPNVQV